MEIGLNFRDRLIAPGSHGLIRRPARVASRHLLDWERRGCLWRIWEAYRQSRTMERGSVSKRDPEAQRVPDDPGSPRSPAPAPPESPHAWREYFRTPDRIHARRILMTGICAAPW